MIDRAQRAALALLVALGLSACQSFGSSLDVIDADDSRLMGASLSPEGLWESSSWDGRATPWLPFPARTVLDIEHGLGRNPRVVLVYLAFDETGDGAALAAGELATLPMPPDGERVQVFNSTNANFFARVVLE